MGNFNDWLDNNISVKMHDWKFQEASGDALDEGNQGFDVDLSPLGSPTRQQAGFTESDPNDLGSEMSHTANRYYLEGSSGPTNGQGTNATGAVIVVAKLDSFASVVTHGRLYQTAANGTNAQGQFNIGFVNDGRFWITINASSGNQYYDLATLVGDNPVGDGNFHTFIVSQEGDGTGAKCYIDGVLQGHNFSHAGTADNDSWWDWLNNPSPPIYAVNREVFQDTNEISGTVSRVLVTTSALTASDVQSFTNFINSSPGGLAGKRRRGRRRGYRPYS